MKNPYAKIARPDHIVQKLEKLYREKKINICSDFNKPFIYKFSYVR